MTQIQTEAEQLYPYGKNQLQNEIHELCRKAYTLGATRNAWVSVDVELPKVDTEWLCWDKANEIILVCLYASNGWNNVWQDDDFNIRNISHYMKLPLPPTP